MDSAKLCIVERSFWSRNMFACAFAERAPALYMMVLHMQHRVIGVGYHPNDSSCLRVYAIHVGHLDEASHGYMFCYKMCVLNISAVTASVPGQSNDNSCWTISISGEAHPPTRFQKANTPSHTLFKNHWPVQPGLRIVLLYQALVSQIQNILKRVHYHVLLHVAMHSSSFRRWVRGNSGGSKCRPKSKRLTLLSRACIFCNLCLWSMWKRQAC